MYIILRSFGVLDDDDDRVASKEELRNIALFVLRASPFAFSFTRHFGPHLKHALQHHVHVAVKGFDVAE